MTADYQAWMRAEDYRSRATQAAIGYRMTPDRRLILLHPDDNVFVCCASIDAGELTLIEGQDIRVNEHIAVGHKVSRRRLEVGAKVLKYGVPIGSVTVAVNPGEHVHLHNLASDYLPGSPLTTREEGVKR